MYLTNNDLKNYFISCSNISNRLIFMWTQSSTTCVEALVEREITPHVEAGSVPAKRTFQVSHTLLGTLMLTNAEPAVVTLKTMEMFFR